MSESWTIQSLSRGLQLLDLIAEQPTGSTVKWLSAVSGIPLSTCYHLVNTLADSGYVEKDKASQTYTLSYKIAYLNNLMQTRHPTPPTMAAAAHELMQALGETTYIAKFEHGDVVVHYIAEGNQAVKVRSLYVGYRGHALLHALGKAVLAHVSTDDLAEYLRAHPPEKRTPRSRVSLDEIQQELLATRERGYSLDEEEWEVGVCCIGAPIFQFDGTVWGALAISMPSSRYRPSDLKTIQYVQEKASTISQSLGYHYIAQREKASALLHEG